MSKNNSVSSQQSYIQLILIQIQFFINEILRVKSIFLFSKFLFSMCLSVHGMLWTFQFKMFYIYTQWYFVQLWGMTSIRLPNAHTYTQFKTVLVNKVLLISSICYFNCSWQPSRRQSLLITETHGDFHKVFSQHLKTTIAHQFQKLLPRWISSREVTAPKPRGQLLPVS